MRLLRIILMLAVVVMTAAQPHCDPLTQYAQQGQCCKMCGPGTSMSSLSTCLEPLCQQCGRNEYQDKYTKESKCQRQPYCDPNRNFQVPVYESTKRSSCMCKLGFHCSTEECITCVPHRTCEPGHGAQPRGNHSHDTVCQKCPESTYSEEKSWDGVCKDWTECGEGQHLQQSGTDISDNVCVEASRTHVVVIVVVLLVVSPGLIAAFMCWQCRGKRGDAKGKVKGCIESCLGEKREPPREAAVLITNPTDHTEEESMSPELLSEQEEGSTRMPVENEDEPSEETSTTDVVLSERGNFVTQEKGKTEILSRQESQTQTLTDGQTAPTKVLIANSM